MEKRVYDREIIEMAASLDSEELHRFLDITEQELQNPVELYGWNAWLGWLGIDRFVVGDIGLGVLKLITFGGFGIWQIVDCFLIGNRTRDKNIEKAREIYAFVTRRDKGAAY